MLKISWWEGNVFDKTPWSIAFFLWFAKLAYVVHVLGSCRETQTVTKTLDVRGSATWWDLLEGTYCFDMPDNMPDAALSPVVSNCIYISAGVIEELTLTWRCKSPLT